MSLTPRHRPNEIDPIKIIIILKQLKPNIPNNVHGKIQSAGNDKGGITKSANPQRKSP
ncbi:hypothetical protein NITUZ_30028 [Candidatus Nitrosotenuis uzonensis]|uniref:Uncharacterized protein n=1 Tax=Candidatus Nitrosotenuis uzonensis TaxID=1407055 RepID=V6ARG9_9ARCH|nr:hypothetical protein NITUZ_30028 [Candidatus Nitrosotenuis uzonensis]